MADPAIFEQALQVMILVLPLAVLGTLFAILRARRARRLAAVSVEAAPVPVRAPSAPQMLFEPQPGKNAVDTGAAGAATSAKETLAPSRPQEPAKAQGEQAAVTAAAKAAYDPEPEAPARASYKDKLIDLQQMTAYTFAPSGLSTAAALEARIAAAEASGEKGTLSLLYLELAQAFGAQGDESRRLTALRSAAGCGAQYGPRAAHALARLALADAAYSAGDLTSACEHWQIARMAYHDDGNKQNFALVDKLMLSHSCPTDWVLTDF